MSNHSPTINEPISRTRAAAAGSYLQSRLLAVPPLVRWVGCALYLALIAGLSLAPPDVFPSTALSFPGADKLAHFVLYGGLGTLLRWALMGPTPPVRYRLALAGALAYGLLMEIMQATLTGGLRTFDWDDLAANAAGVLLFWILTNRWLANSTAAFPRQ